MAKFIIKEVREIVNGFYTQSYEVEAESKEEALKKVENFYDDETDVEYIDQDFDIRDSEFLYYDSDED